MSSETVYAICCYSSNVSELRKCSFKLAIVLVEWSKLFCLSYELFFLVLVDDRHESHDHHQVDYNIKATSTNDTIKASKLHYFSIVLAIKFFSSPTTASNFTLKTIL